MQEFKRVIRLPSVLLFLFCIVFVNIGMYLYEQFPNFNIEEKRAETAVYHRLLREHSDHAALTRDMILQKRMEAAAYQILQHPESFLHAQYKELFPTIWEEVSAGRVMKDAGYYEFAYGRLQEQLGYFETFAGREAKMEKEYAEKSRSPLFKKQKHVLLNMEKTLRDFKASSKVHLRLGDDRALTSVIETPFTNFLLFIFLAFIALNFISERKSGLWEIVHASKKGRTNLSLHRLFCLSLFTLLASVLLFLPTLLLSFALYDGYHQLGRSVQSVSAYAKFLWPMQIGEFLLLYYGIKLLTAFFVGLMIWLLLSSAANSNVAVFLASAFLLVQYGLSKLPLSSAFAPYRYWNIFSYMQPLSMLVSYYNAPVFGRLFNMPLLSLYLLVPMIVTASALQLFLLSKKKPGNRLALFEKWLSYFTRLRMRISPHVPAFFREIYKKLVLEGWLLPLCLLLYIGVSYQAPQRQLEETDIYKRPYYMQFYGVEEKTLEDSLQKEEETLSGKIDEVQQKLQKEEGMSRVALLDAWENLENKKNALDQVRAEAAEIQRVNERQAVKARLSEPYLTEAILGKKGADYRGIRAFLLLFFVVLQSSALLSFERQEKLLPIVRASKKGVAGFWRKKMAVHGLFISVSYACIFIPELHALLTQKYISIFAAMQSFPSFRDFPYAVSLLGYSALLYGFRLLAVIGFSFVIVYFSSFMKSAFASSLLLVSLFVLPQAIAFALGKTSPILPSFFVSATWPLPNTIFILVLVFFLVCLAAYCLMKKRLRRLV